MKERGEWSFWDGTTYKRVSYRYNRELGEFKLYSRNLLTNNEMWTMVDIMSEAVEIPRYIYQWKYNTLGMNPATKLGYRVYRGFTVHYLDVDRT